MRRLFSRLRPSPELSDRHLLDRYLTARDEAAFAELVRRHGSLVWGVCRRTLAPADAEDAFQATFLVLLRRRPAGESLGPWLYRAAVLTSRTARRAERRRRDRVRVGLPAAETAVEPDPTSREAVDAALLRLPERDRAAVVLCYLQGHTRAEAAKRLGVPEGTLSARLSRAIARLRLGADPAALLAVAGAGLVPAGLEAAAARAGELYLAGGAVPPAVATITRGVLTMSAWKTATAVGLVLVGLAGTGAGVALRAAAEDKPAAQAKPDPLVEAERRVVAARHERDMLAMRLDVARSFKAQADEAVAQAERALADLREKAAGKPATALVLTDDKGGWNTRYLLKEPLGDFTAEYSVNAPVAMQRLLARTRADRPDLPLTVELPGTYNESSMRLVLETCQHAGFRSVYFVGPDLADLKKLAAGPGREFAADNGQRMYAGPLDLSKLK